MNLNDPTVDRWTGQALTSGSLDMPNNFVGPIVRAITKGSRVGTKRGTRELLDEGQKAKVDDVDTAKLADELEVAPDVEPAPEPVEPAGLTSKDAEEVVGNQVLDPSGTETLDPVEFAQKVSEEGAKELEKRTWERNLNLDYLENADQIGGVIEQVSKQIAAAPHKSFAETQKAVEDKGAGNTFIEALRRDGGNLTEEEMLAGRQIMVTMAEDLDGLTKSILDGTASAEDMLRMEKVQQQYVMVQKYMQGQIRAAGRTLNSMKIIAQTVNAGDIKQISGMADTRSAQIKAQMYQDMRKENASLLEMGESLEKLGAFRKYTAALVNYRNAAILTGPKTHAVNLVSNALMTTVRSTMIRPVAAGVGFIRTAGRNGADRVYMAETAAETAGFFHGFGDAVTMAAKVFKEGTFQNEGEYVSSFGGRKIDEAAEDSGLLGDLLKEDVPWSKFTGVPQTLNALQRTTEAASYGLLTASDEFFKSIAYRKSLYGLATRQAFTEGAEDPAARANELLNNVTKDMHDEAIRYSEEVTFTNKTKEGAVLTIFADALIKAGQKFPPLKIMVPFVRTPTALFDRSIKYSPLATLQKEFWDRVQKGGPDADMAIAEMAFGTTVTGMLYMAYQSDLITGKGPGMDTQGQRNQTEALKALNWQPNSIKVGSAYISITRGMEPFNLAIIGIADYMDKVAYSQTEAEAADYIAGISFAIAKHFKDNTYMQGVADLMDVMSGRVNPEKWAAKQASSFIPSLLRDASAVTEGLQGEEKYGYVPSSHSFWEMFSQYAANRMPGMQPQAIRRYWDGTPVVGGGGEALYLYNTVSPIRVTIGRNDKASSEMAANGVRVSPPNPEISIASKTGVRVNLLELSNGAELYDKLTEFVGKARREILDKVVEDKDYIELEKESTRPGSVQSMILENALQKGRDEGEERFIRDLIDNPLDPEVYGEEAVLLDPAKLERMLEVQERGDLSYDQEKLLIDAGSRTAPTRERLYVPDI